MNEIQIIKRDGQPVVSSREVAEKFGKDHKNVLRSIQELGGGELKIELSSMFYESTYTSAQNKELPMYLMNRDGFSLLAMGFTGKEALAWKLKYIDAFNRMEATIREGGKALPQDDAARMRAEAMLKNAQTRQFNAIMKTIENKQLSAVAAEVFGISAIEQLTGKEITYRPQLESKMYTATEIGKEMGVGAGIVGAIANKHDLKTEEYGIWILDKSRSSDKQVKNFLYNERGRERLKALIPKKTA